MAAINPIRTASFVDSIGVNTHMHWRASDSAYANTAAVKNALAYLGVDHVRDSVPTEGWTMPIYRELAAKGISFDIVTTGSEFSATGNYVTDLNRIETLLKAYPGSVSAIEGLNEINRFPVSWGGGSTGSDISLGRGIQAELYNEVNARSALADIPVLNLTVGGLTAQEAAKLGNMSGMADYGNWHIYFGNGDQPGKNITSGIAAAKSVAPSDPVIITEANYYTAINAMEWGGGGVTEAVQAKLNLNLLMDAKSAGAERVFLYELMDNSLKAGATQTVEGSLGLFHSDGTPKQAATAIHNLISILDDTAANADSFQTQALDFTLSGMPATGRSMLMQDANGSYNLAVWAEPDVWNEQSRTAINVGTSSVTVDLAGTASTIKVYDPLKGTSPIATYNNTDKVVIAISDHPLIVEVNGLAADNAQLAEPNPIRNGYTTTIGSGTDTLALRLSQHAWNGDAQYKVYVDGQQIGGTLTAQSDQGSGITDVITVKGNWDAGTHRAEVVFINDAYGGTTSTDRNLFLESASYESKSVSGVKNITGSGTGAFSFTDTTATAGKHDFTVDANTALTGNAGAQSWGGVGVVAKDWNGAVTSAVKTVDGLGAKGGRFDNQIDHNPSTGKSETITLDFHHDVDYATLRFSRAASSENGAAERAAWKAYDANGAVVGSGVLDPSAGTSLSYMTYDFKLDPTQDFAKLEISGAAYANAWSATDSSDVSLARVIYHTTDAVF